MDRSHQTQHPRQHELVFCHQCNDEWYRDEHGIVCPECQSDFTEIIEADHDPRQEEDHPQRQGGADQNLFAPDPDIADIDDLHWENHAAGQPPGGRLTGTITRNITLGPNGPQGGGLGGGGLMGLIGPAIQGLIGQGARVQQNQQNQATVPGQGYDQAPPGSPRGQQQQQNRGNGGTFTRHATGPGYSYTITTSSSSNLYPRNANGPQPFQGQPDHINNMMAQMFANIVPGGPGVGFAGGGGMHGGPMFMGMGPPPTGGHPGYAGGPGPMPLGNLFQILGLPPGGVHGDAVYTQEALDRVMTQLMEQHQSGNAPGPATAEAIDSLPKRPISQKDLGENGKADCSICMDEAEVGSIVTELPCGHWFHHDCIKAWLGEHDTCPHCRQGIMPRDEPNTSRPRQPSQTPLNDMYSPEYLRANASGAEGSRDSSRQNGGSGGSLFGRMRQAFNPGGGSHQGGNREGTDRNSPPGGW